MKKKTWKKPKLEILVRMKPDESVLTPCKTAVLGAGRQRCNPGQCTSALGTS